jgi:hypothetical protein
MRPTALSALSPECGDFVSCRRHRNLAPFHTLDLDRGSTTSMGQATLAKERRREMGPLTREDVLSVVGPVDEVMIADVIATQATLAELSQAWAWVNSDEALINEGRPLPSGRTAELVELLTSQDEGEERDS